tara:strand:- start:53631 stop:54038 length:408 start_codon:yes stop_codon:yes gene_type:complete
MLIFANFDLTKVLRIKGIEEALYLPVPILFPLFFFFLYVNVHYLKFSYAEGKNTLQKVVFGFINIVIVIIIFTFGFEFWKLTKGDIDIAFFGVQKDAFQVTFRNLYFWVFYQTILMAYGLSVLKIMVSQPKKRIK